MKQHISVTIHASLREGKHASGSASALFIGGFSLLDTGKVMTDYKICAVKLKAFSCETEDPP